jgi:propanol-preferring alcohol dehydrogenase
VPGIAPVLMKAGPAGEPGPFEDHRLAEVTRPIPHPGPARVRPGRATVVAEIDGVRRTDLHLAESDLSLKRGRVAQYRRGRK